jgi:hypothetical protein
MKEFSAIHEDEPLEQRTWTIERIAWVVMVALLVAASLGLFGSGPLSKRTIESENGAISIAYERVARMRAASEIEIRIRESAFPVALDRGTPRMDIAFDRHYWDDLQVTRIVPEPVNMVARGSALVCTFPRFRGHELLVTFQTEPKRMGMHTARIRILPTGEVESTEEGGFSFRQLVLP